jgi:hypothetical protein
VETFEVEVYNIAPQAIVPEEDSPGVHLGLRRPAFIDGQVCRMVFQKL